MSRSARLGFWAGVVAGGIAVTAIYLGLFTSGTPAVALALWDRMLRAVPMELFSFFLVRLKFAAKPSAFWAMLLGLVVLCGLLGAALAGRRPAARLILAWVISAAALAALSFGPATVTLDAARSAMGESGNSARAVAAAIAVYAALFALVYAAAVAMMLRRVAPDQARVTPPRSDDGPTRREVLSRGLKLALAAAAGTALGRWIATAGDAATALAQSLFSRVKDLPPEITPNDRFYVVSKNPPGFDPKVDGSRWSLEVAGLVARPFKMSYQQLRALPAVEQLQTLECISNEVGGDLISNAKWKGVRLRDVLEQAGALGARAVKVSFRCADGYTESIPVADALNPTTLLAYEMNGETLPAAHGYPVRLLVPGLFGMKNPKWITRIEVVDYDFQGYWERSGWSDEAVVKTMSQFATRPRSVGLEEVPLGGIAYGGDRGIREVEVSTDGGKTWTKAEGKPALGPFTWVLWAALWKPTAAGEYTLRVRAKDGGGVVQVAKDAPPLPDGATGYHTLRVRVRK